VNPELHTELVRLGVSAPEKETQFLTVGAVAGVIRWTKDQNKQGRLPSSNAIVSKLRGGGLEGYGTLSDGPKAWYRSSVGRWRWMFGDQRPDGTYTGGKLSEDIDPVYAEAAIISLIAQRREPSSNSVKALAFQLEREQAAYEEACQRG
jgi:hypothetical protein